MREGIHGPALRQRGRDVQASRTARDQRMATARHRVNYHPGTRLARSAEIDLVEHDGDTRTIALDPILKFQMKGLGYGHPEWGQGMWKGELAVGGESFDPETDRSRCRPRTSTPSRWSAPATAERRASACWSRSASAPTPPAASRNSSMARSRISSASPPPLWANVGTHPFFDVGHRLASAKPSAMAWYRPSPSRMVMVLAAARRRNRSSRLPSAITCPRPAQKNSLRRLRVMVRPTGSR